MIKDLKLQGELGFIPGPGETEAEYVKRLDILQTLSKDPSTFLKKGNYEPLSCDFNGLGAKPMWVPLTYSNRNLLPWQGAVSWTFTSVDGVFVPMIQLRKGFKKGKYLFYDRDEVLRHEAVHAMRLGFNEPRFEEILAYFHSKKKWRRFLGPLFRKPSQSLLFISLIFISLGCQISTLFFLTSPFLFLLKGATYIPFIYLFALLISLMKDQRTFRKTLQTLKNLFPNQEDPYVVAVRLKDTEIKQFATKPLEDLLLYIKEKTLSSIRWQQILAQFS